MYPNTDTHTAPAFKPSPIGPIPVDWEVKKFGEVFSFFPTNSFSRDNLTEEETNTRLNNIHYGDIHSKFNNPILSIENEKLPMIKDPLVKNLKFSLIQDGDLIIADASEDYEGVGKCIEVANVGGRKVVAGLHTFLARSNKDEVADGFKTYLFKNDRVKIALKKIATGISVFSISKNNLQKLFIPLPPLPEQKAIARVLSTWDEAIEKANALLAQKQQRKKWLMQQLLTGKKRLPGFDGEWREYHLEDMFSERNETKYVNLPLLSVGANGIYPQSDSDKKDTSNDDKSKYKRICPGDIGYNTMRMWQGRSALSNLEGIVSPAYTIVKPKPNADSLFFAYLFKTAKMVNLFWRNSQGMVDDTLNCKFKDFSIIKIHLPLVTEQTAIAQVLQTADKEIDLLQQQLEQLKTQKKGLMQVLLTGQVRVKQK